MTKLPRIRHDTLKLSTLDVVNRALKVFLRRLHGGCFRAANVGVDELNEAVEVFRFDLH